MATVVYDNAILLVGGYDVTGSFNELTLEHASEIQDETAFGDLTRIHKGGLETTRLTGRGFWESPTPDSVFFPAIGTDDTVVTVFPDGVTEGSTGVGSGYAFKSVLTTYNLGGAVGNLLPFDVTAENRGID